MNNTLLKQKNKILNLIFIDNFNIKNKFRFPKIKKSFLSFSIRNLSVETNFIFPKTLWLLEHLTLQKGFVKSYNFIRKGRNERRIFFSSQVNLNDLLLINFFYYFIIFGYLNLSKKLLKMNLEVDNLGNYSFFIKDINIFPGFLENFFKWQYPLIVNIIFENSNYFKSMTFFQEIGFDLSD